MDAPSSVGSEQETPDGSDVEPDVTRPRLFVAAFTLMAAITTIAAGSRTFHTNDDAAMAALASGDFTGTPDGHLVFIEPLASFPLAWLYRLVGVVPWYGVALYAIHCVALVAIADVLWRRRSEIGILPASLAAATLLAFEPRLLLQISFTTTAYMAALAAVVLLVDIVSAGGWASHRLRGALCGLLLIAALSVRTDAVFGVIIVAFPLIALLTIRRWRSVAPFVAIGVATEAINTGIIRFFLGAPYRTFLDYNTARGFLHGTPRLSADALDDDVLSSLGWTQSDRQLFGNFFYDDPKRFGLRQVEIVLKATSDTRLPFDSATIFGGDLTRYPLLIGAAGVVIACFVRRREWTAMASAASVAVVGLAAMTWILLTNRLPERAALPTWMSIVVLASAAVLVARIDKSPAPPPSRDGEARPVRRSDVIAAGLVAALLIGAWVSPVGPVSTTSANEERKAILESQLGLFREVTPDEVILASGASLAVEGTDPLSTDGVYSDERVLLYGWTTFSPAFETRKRHAGVDDSMRDMLTRSDLLWFATPDITDAYQAFLVAEAKDPDSVPNLTVQSCNGRRGPCLWVLEWEPIGPIRR